MKYEDAVEIERIARVVATQREFVHALRMRNVAGLSTEDRIQATVEYELAMANLGKAEGELRQAQADMILHGELRPRS